jgi:hypothetical protein
VTEKDKAAYTLLRNAIVVNNYSFSWFDKEENRSASKYEDHWMSSKTVKNLLMNTVPVVEKKLREELPDKFAIYFDGWTHNRLHFIAIVASYIKGGQAFKRLLSLSPLTKTDGDDDSDEFVSLMSPTDDNGNAGLSSDFDAATILKNIKSVLSLYYGKTVEANVTNFGGDNCSINHKVASDAKKWYDGCLSHQLALQMSKYCESKEALGEAREAVLNVMNVGRTLKGAAALSNITHLTAVIPGATRWSSNAMVLRRYCQLEEAKAMELEIFRAAAPSTQGLRNKVQVARSIFGTMNVFVKKLQADSCNPADVNLRQSRIIAAAAASCLEAETDKYSILRAGGFQCAYLRPDSELQNKPPGNAHFLNGLVKIQGRQELQLTTEEEEAVAVFLKPAVAAASEDDDGELEPPLPLSPESKRRKKESDIAEKYLKLTWN